MPQLFQVHEQCLQGSGHVWKLNLVKGTEKNWENIYKTYCKWDAIWIFLTHFGDQQCAHSSAGAATERMAKLEALQTSLVELLNQKELPLSLHFHSRGRNKTCNNCMTKWQLQLYYSRQDSVASLCFFSDNIKYWVNQLSTFGVVTLTGFSATNCAFHSFIFRSFTFQFRAQTCRKLLPCDVKTIQNWNQQRPCLRPIVAGACQQFDTFNPWHLNPILRTCFAKHMFQCQCRVISFEQSSKPCWHSIILVG